MNKKRRVLFFIVVLFISVFFVSIPVTSAGTPDSFGEIIPQYTPINGSVDVSMCASYTATANASLAKDVTYIKIVNYNTSYSWTFYDVEPGEQVGPWLCFAGYNTTYWWYINISYDGNYYESGILSFTTADSTENENAPYLVSIYPSGSTSSSYTVPFSANAYDDDNDLVFVEWYYNGAMIGYDAVVNGHVSFVYTFDSSVSGLVNYTVRVTDGTNTVDYNRSFYMSGGGYTGTFSSDDLNFLIGIGVVCTMAGIGAFLAQSGMFGAIVFLGFGTLLSIPGSPLKVFPDAVAVVFSLVLIVFLISSLRS